MTNFKKRIDKIDAIFAFDNTNVMIQSKNNI